MTLPVVDLRDLDADLLREATHEIGFCYLVGHVSRRTRPSAIRWENVNSRVL